jgi:hypothetical protein
VIDGTVHISGLREVRNAVRAVEKQGPQAMRAGLKDIATDVARKAAARVPARTGRAASSVKPRATQTGGAIAVGGTRAPYYAFLDWGGSTGRGHRPGVANSGSVKRPWSRRGRYLYPTINDERETTIRKVDALLAALFRRYGFETHGGTD